MEQTVTGRSLRDGLSSLREEAGEPSSPEASIPSACDDEQFASLKRAFVDRKANFIILDGWSGRWLWGAVHAAVVDGLIYEDATTSADNSDDQYTAVCFRPTEKLFTRASAIPAETRSKAPCVARQRGPKASPKITL